MRKVFLKLSVVIKIAYYGILLPESEHRKKCQVGMKKKKKKGRLSHFANRLS